MNPLKTNAPLSVLYLSFYTAKIKKMSDPSASDLTVVIDLNYEDLMNDKYAIIIR